MGGSSNLQIVKAPDVSFTSEAEAQRGSPDGTLDTPVCSPRFPVHHRSSFLGRACHSELLSCHAGREALEQSRSFGRSSRTVTLAGCTEGGRVYVVGAYMLEICF